jgi:ubiquinol-cytochrome c reductase cytochrome b subunit
MKANLKQVLLGKPFFVPKNLNFWYVFGSLLLFSIVIQYISGLWLALYYQPSSDKAFASVQHIMHQVHYGWLIRYLHTTCASALFVLLYLHIIRGLLYRSYRSPRQLVWYFGVLMFWLIMIESFLGYVLPWGQMSYWGATIATNLLTALPHGNAFATWLCGDYRVSSVTLTRFYALHVVALPILLIFLIQWHIRALHQVGSSNPKQLAIDNRSLNGQCPENCIPFFPIQFLKDLLAILIFLIIFSAILFFKPQGFGLFIDHLNYAPADPTQTPTEIRPLWYLASFYSLLRAVPSKLGGIFLMMLSLVMWFFIPWLDRRAIRKADFLHKIIVWCWFFCWLMLTYFGLSEVSPSLTYILLGLSGVYLLLFVLVGII